MYAEEDRIMKKIPVRLKNAAYDVMMGTLSRVGEVLTLTGAC